MTALSQPLTLPCGATLRNRIAKAALTEGLATPDGLPTPPLERLYRIWADSGAGLLITGNVQIDRDHLERPGNVIIDGPPSEELKATLKTWSTAATGNEKNHFGRKSLTLGDRPKSTSIQHPRRRPQSQWAFPN